MSFITLIDSLGRDLKWNPRIHTIVSLGWFNKYFHAKSITNQWKSLVLDIISNGKYPNRHIRLNAKNTVNLLYKIDKRFFFNIGNGHINNNKEIIKYLGRYLAGSPIAEYKISSISNDSVSFFFYDLKLNKKKTLVTMPLVKFITQILIHLSPKNFKMISRFGFMPEENHQNSLKLFKHLKLQLFL